MEKVEQYRQYVQNTLKQYVEKAPSDEYVEVDLCFDTERDHYQIINVGWIKKQRIYGCVLHVDLKQNKIWIQHDGTEDGIANAFLELGVPKSDIVLAFHLPSKRKFTGFAVM